MSSRARSTRLVRRSAQEIPKKSKTVLIIVIIIIILVVLTSVGLALYFLWWRRRTTTNTPTTPTTTVCKTNADCTGGKLCNAVTGVCIECFDNGDCDGATPICDLNTATCVAGCLDDSNCSGGTPVCDVPNNACVECLVNTDCPTLTDVCDGPTNTCVPGCLNDGDCSGGTPTCDLSINQCVECVSDANCFGGTPICQPSTKTCVECTSDANCSGGTPNCKTATGSCVECVSNSDCSGLTPTCNTTLNICGNCTNNADCTNPEICFNSNCCIETVSGPPLGFSITFVTVAGGNIQMCFSATLTQNPSDLNASILIYSDTDAFIDRTSTFTPANGNQCIIFAGLDAQTVLFSGVQYKFKLEIASKCGSWAQTSGFVSALKNCSFAQTQGIGSFISWTADSGLRQVTISLNAATPVANPSLGFGIKIGTQAYENDYDYIVRNVSGAPFYSYYTYTVTIPAGPPISPGDPLGVIAFVESAEQCYAFSQQYSGLIFV